MGHFTFVLFGSLDRLDPSEVGLIAGLDTATSLRLSLRGQDI